MHALLDWIVLVACGWLLIGLIGIAFSRQFLLITRLLFPFGAALGLLLAALAWKNML